MRTPRISSKLDGLPATLDLFAGYDASTVAKALTKGAGRHALALGSGGSVVAAEYLVRCRDTLGLGPTTVATPMQGVLDNHRLDTTEVWLFSAGGDNPDVCAAARSAVDRGVAALHLVTRNENGAAGSIVAANGGTVHTVPVADEKDGYLATHSLLAMTTALLLASGIASRQATTASDMLDRLVARLTASRLHETRDHVAQRWRGLRPTDTIVIAADPLVRPVASLIDTSLWEASLCPVQTTDFRNLAHGRHAWLHHREADTVVLALTGISSQATWSAIEAVIPAAVRREATDLGSGGRLDNLLGIIDGLSLIEAFGEVLGIDPGKPGIGDFGRTIYDDRSLEAVAAELPARVRHKRAAIAKADGALSTDASLALVGRERLEILHSANIEGLVFDYDGTIVRTDGRFDPPDRKIIDELVRLHRAGVRLGVATGRGGSAGEELRKVLPADMLPSVLIGYYNGGHLRTADIDIATDPPAQDPAIAATAEWLDGKDDLFIEKVFKAGPVQIGIDMDRLRHPYRFALDIAQCPQLASGEVKISASGHSFDIIPAKSTKIVVVEEIRKLAPPGTEILCFGDSGSSCGNDHALLAHPHGISVGEVCDAADGCWSLFGGAVTGPEALLRTLRALVASPTGEIRLDAALLSLDSLSKKECKTRT